MDAFPGALHIETGSSLLEMAPVVKSVLPLTKTGQSVQFQIVPSSNLETMPKLCGYVDEFQVIAFNLGTTVDSSSPPTTIHLHFQCDLPVCAAGEEAVHLHVGHVRLTNPDSCHLFS
jgi:hypothetical protein